MSIERAKQLITQKENIRLEFKKAATALPGNLFETICAMLNRDGGDIILGVNDKNTLLGVDPAAVQTMITNLVNMSNNPQKLDPPFILFPLDPKNFAPFPKNPAIAKFFIQLGRGDELGSGVLNVNRLIKEYAGKDAPQFIEGPVFKMELPVPEVDDTINDTINDTISDTIKQRLSKSIILLFNNPGLKTQELAKEFSVSEVTIKRDLQKIRKLVEYRGSKKTGGYILTDFMKGKLTRD